jgi:hypothetical protein
MRITSINESALEDKMDHSSPADLSLEAALELEEVKQHIRQDAPSLNALFRLISTPLPAFDNGQSVSMLADARAYPLLRDSTRFKIPARNAQEFMKVIQEYLTSLEEGVARVDLNKIEEAKRFCLALNAQVLAKEMGEFYARRERQDSRNVFDGPIL